MKFLFRSILLSLCIGLAAVGAAQSVESQQTYKVKKKDTVYGIARKYNISIDELLSANPFEGAKAAVISSGVKR